MESDSNFIVKAPSSTSSNDKIGTFCKSRTTFRRVVFIDAATNLPNIVSAFEMTL